MNDINNCNFTGRLTRDSELAYTSKGIPLCKFSIAVNKKGKDQKDFTSFLNCELWGNYGQTMSEFLKKGVSVSISSEVKTGSYEKNDGSKVFTVNFVVNNVIVHK